MSQRKEARIVFVRTVRVLLLLLGVASGYRIASSNVWHGTFAAVAPGVVGQPWIGAVIGGLVGLMLVPWVGGAAERLSARFVAGIQRTSIHEILAGAAGCWSGLLMAILLTLPLPRHIPVVGEYLPMAVTVIGGYIGWLYFCAKKTNCFNWPKLLANRASSASPMTSGHKILDTSVIIDGRIADIARTGFIEGTLLIPGFVSAGAAAHRRLVRHAQAQPGPPRPGHSQPHAERVQGDRANHRRRLRRHYRGRRASWYGWHS